MEKRSWAASGKERTSGRLLKYTLIALVGAAFAGVAIIVQLVRQGEFWQALVGGLIGAAITAVFGLIVWYAYKSLVLNKK
jgi:hypothetical protein